jgi:hypothetical protein
MRNILDESCRENENTETVSRNSCRLWDNVEKRGTARQAADDNIILRMRFACWITKATDTYWEYEIRIAFFYGNNGYENAPRIYIVWVVTLLKIFKLSWMFEIPQ